MTVATRDLGHTHVAQGYHRTWQHLLRTLPIRTRAIVLNRIPATWNWNKKLGISMVLQFGVCISRLSSQHSWYYLHLCCRTWASESNKFKQSQSPTLTTQHHLLQHLEKHGPSGLPGKNCQNDQSPKALSLLTLPETNQKSTQNPKKIQTKSPPSLAPGIHLTLLRQRCWMVWTQGHLNDTFASRLKKLAVQFRSCQTWSI